MLNDKKRRELLGLSLLALSIFTFLSLVPVVSIPKAADIFATGNVMGVLGRWFAFASYSVLGVGALTIPIIFLLAGAASFDWIRRDVAVQWSALLAGLSLIVPSIAALFCDCGGAEIAVLLVPQTAGWIGRTIATPLVALLGRTGGVIALGFMLIALFVATVGWNPVAVAWRRFRSRRETVTGVGAVAGVESVPREELYDEPEIIISKKPATVAAAAPSAALKKKPERLKPEEHLEDLGRPDSIDLPPLSLLTEQPEVDQAGNE